MFNRIASRAARFGGVSVRMAAVGAAAVGAAAAAAATSYQTAPRASAESQEAPLESRPAEETPDFVPAVPVMSPKEFVEVEVGASYDHTRDSKLVTVNVAPEGGEFPTCSFVLVKATVDGKEVVRPYTPVYSDARGGMILAVKEYEEGKVSKVLCNLEPGAKIEIKGPLPKMEYKEGMVKDLAMIAGGSGITPMYQLIQKVWESETDETNVTLVYANRSPNHVMLGHLLETLFHYRESSTLVHVLEEDAPTNMDHVHSGRVTKELLAKYLPEPSKEALVAVCGPPAMVAAVSGPKAKDYSQGTVSGMLKELGWDESNVYKF